MCKATQQTYFQTKSQCQSNIIYANVILYYPYHSRGQLRNSSLFLKQTVT